MAANASFAFLTSMILATSVQAASTNLEVRSADGTPIAFECTGAGPELLIVHGGTGDRTRWMPMVPHLERTFTVCLMDRRGHGKSGDAADYSLALEAQDVLAVVESRKRPVNVLGHSFGAVTAFDAAFLSPRIAKLLLYEPPVRVGDATPILAKMEELIRQGQHADATAMFMREIVLVSPQELAAMRDRPVWKTLVSSIEGSIRQHRALMQRTWDASRVASLDVPTLVITGAKTVSADLKLSAKSLVETLPNVKLRVLAEQEHNAMDTARESLAAIIRTFVLTGE